MQRKEAEKLLAALIFDDLDEASKTELLNYLQTDNELRERLADMRMAVKVASDTVQHGPDPVLGKRRLKRLARLAGHHRTWTTIFTVPRLAAAAAIFIIAALGLIGIRSTDKARVASTVAHERVSTYNQIHSESPVDAPSRGKQATEITFTGGRGQYVYDPAARGPDIVDKGYAYDQTVRGPGAVDSGTVINDENYYTKNEIGGIAGAKISSLHGDVDSSVRAVPTEKWDSGSSFEGKLHGGTASREGLMETDRKARIEDLMESAMVLQGQMRYEEALGQLESLQVLDPMNDNALIQKQTLEDMISYRRQIEVERKKSKEGIDVLRKTAEASIPYSGVINYPDDWDKIIASPFRKPEEPLGQGHYALDPAARSPKVGERITFIGGETDFTKNKIGGITGAQTSSLHGYDYSPPKTGQIERWDSASSFESKPRSGMDEGSEYVSTGRFPGSNMGMGGYGGGGYGGGMGGMGGGYSSRGGDGSYGDGSGYSSSSYPHRDFYFHSGRGGDGGNGKDGGGIMAPYPGGGYGGGYGGGGYGGMGGGYSFSGPGWKGGKGGDGGNGVMSGDTLIVDCDLYEGDIDFKGKEINWFDISSDDPGVVADGGIAGGGRVEFQNGIAAGITKDGLAIDSFDAYIDKDGDRSPVAIDSIKPVTSMKPELTPRTRRSFGLDIQLGTSTKPESASQSQPMRDISGISDLPDIKLQTEGGESHVVWEDTKTDASRWYPRRSFNFKGNDILKKIVDEAGTTSYHYQLIPEKTKTKPHVPGLSLVVEGSRQDDVSKEKEAKEESGDELVDMGYHYVPEKAKPPVAALGKVVEGSRQGDVIRESDEAAIPYSAVTSGSSLETTITNVLQPTDEIKALLKKGQSTDYVSLVPAEGPADKRESGGGPIVSKIPQVGLTIIDCDFQDSRGSGDKKESRLEQIVEDMPIAGGLFRPDGKERSLTDEEKGRILNTRKFHFHSEGESAIAKSLTQLGLDVKYRADEKSAVDLTAIPTEEVEAELPPASRFKLIPVNPWVMSERDSFSTFALDVDTASYTLCRRYIGGGFLPPAGAVRMEEFVNYFNYQYPQRTNPTFKVHAEAAPSPFARKDQNLTLLKVGVKARTIGRDQRKAAHLIFVVDASASMGQPDRLPLVQQALDLLVSRLSEVDRVSLITCANEARLHLESTSARERDRIRQAIYAIQPAGSTNLLAGLKLGYATARRSFAPKQINHVVLCSDGVANVGQTEAEAVLGEVAADRKQGITITCVGVGYGSYNDAFMEALANRGDGSYMFLDSARQAQRVFVRQLAATLQTVAKDARIQVDFNPNRVRRYRLIGYENRDIEDKRFRDDTIDAGEVGSGQCSTALYELELTGQSSADKQGDLGTVFVRYRNVATGQIEEISSRLGSAIVRRRTVESAPRFFLAAGAARFAEILRQSEHAQHGNLMDVLRVVEQVSLALPLDRDVRELAELVRKAEGLPRSP